MGISHTHHINKQTNTNQVFAKLYTLRALQSRVSFLMLMRRIKRVLIKDRYYHCLWSRFHGIGFRDDGGMDQEVD